MAGSPNATLTSALVRSVLVAAATGVIAWGTAFAQIDEPHRCANKPPAAKKECRAFNRSIEDEKQDALITGLLAAAGVIAGRGAVEGALDRRRQVNGDVKPSDVQS